MIELDFIRKFPDDCRKAMENRGVNASIIDEVLKLDSEYRKLTTKLQSLQQEKNKLAKSFTFSDGNADSRIEKSKLLSKEICEIENKLSNNNLNDTLQNLPNIPSFDIPIGQNEGDNKEVKKHGSPASFNFPIKPHNELGEDLGLMDFQISSKICGPRFSYIKGELVLMERALSTFMLDIHISEFGYQEISAPLLVKESAMYAVGQLPKFDADSFKTTCGFRLIPTGEVTLTNMALDKVFDEEELPVRLTTFSQCFRSEAGSAGKDTKGIIRQHQFSKVELVSFTTKNDSEKELERMLSCAEEILKRLDLPYRVMLLCTGDMGFGSQKTFDIEVWMPEQKKYREISSCSNFGSFQSRRLHAKYKSQNKKEFIHTLNGSGLAIGRTMAAIMENYQNEDGSISVPNALQKYMKNLKVITCKK